MERRRPRGIGGGSQEQQRPGENLAGGGIPGKRAGGGCRQGCNATQYTLLHEQAATAHTAAAREHSGAAEIAGLQGNAGDEAGHREAAAGHLAAAAVHTAAVAAAKNPQPNPAPNAEPAKPAGSGIRRAFGIAGKIAAHVTHAAAMSPLRF